MIKRPFLFALVCFGIIIFFQSLVPTVLAMDRDLNEYTLEDQRTRKRKNYMFRLGRGNDKMQDIDSNIGPRYETDSLQPDPNSEELSALMVDYANMMRNDVILLDNSIETRTRKRGNIKVEKHQAIPDLPCSCESVRETKDLGENSIPRYVETRNCSKARQQTCRPPYICKENTYNLIILTKRERGSRNQESTELPDDFKYKWFTEKRPISVGCMCVSEYKY